jgi:hypothetical protein
MFESESIFKKKIPFEQVLYWTNWLESLENPNRNLMLPNTNPNKIMRNIDKIEYIKPN